MRAKHSLIPIFLFLSIALAPHPVFADSDTTQGGNITRADLLQPAGSSLWHGIYGQTAPTSFLPLSLVANPGGVTYLTANTGSIACEYGIDTLNIMFSEEPIIIPPLFAGSLPALDLFIPDPLQNGSSTFRLLSSFKLSNYTLYNVPTTTTISSGGQNFTMAYLQDSAGNFVFATPAVPSQPSFEGTPANFQLMVPTNGTNKTYYYIVDLRCKPNPQPPTPANVTTGNNGGGAIANGTCLASTANFSLDYPLHAGNGNFCMIHVYREIRSTCHGSQIITNLTNNGAEGCNLTDFTFAEVLPERSINLFSSMNFSPMYNTTYESLVVYRFSSFPQEQVKTLRYGLPGWFSPSKLNEFTSFAMYGTSDPRPYLPPQLPPPVLPREDICKARPSTVCGQWSECIGGQRSRTCTDVCSLEHVWVENCEMPQAAWYERYWCICPLLLLLLLLLLLAKRRKKAQKKDAREGEGAEKGKENAPLPQLEVFLPGVLPPAKPAEKAQPENKPTAASIPQQAKQSKKAQIARKPAKAGQLPKKRARKARK